MRVMVVALFIVCLNAFAAKPAWMLTPEERAVLRADPLARTERHRMWVSDGRHAVDAGNDVVDGARTPEVIAPIELMDILLSTYSLLEKDDARKEQFRQDWNRRGGSERLGPRFWEELRTLFQPMIAIHEKTRRQPGDASADCAATAEALILGRQTYGREKFDRFLYDVIAPGAFWSSSTSSTDLHRKPEHWLDEWNWKEAGCR